MQNIGDNIWQVSALTPGPSLLVLGGIHGNERAGIAVVQELRKAFDEGELSLVSGTLTLAIGNPRAVAADERFIEGRDLNRYFTDLHLAGQDGSEEERRAIELAQLIKAADATIDIHSTNKPSIAFIATQKDAAHERIYRWFASEAILTDPYCVLGGEPATTDEYADRIGRLGICVETGDAADMTVVPRTIISIQAVMNDLGMMTTPVKMEPQKPTGIYMLTEAILLDERGFKWAEGRGERSFEPVRAQEIVGYREDLPVVAGEDCVIVFPKLPKHQALGRAVGYFAKEINSEV